MRFLTWANDPADPRCDLLFASARHFGIEVEPIGVGKEYRGGVSKIEWLADALKGMEDNDETVICTDAHDVLYVGQPVEDYAEGIIGFAAQRWYRHQPEILKEQYDRVECESIYRYPDAGIVNGTARDLYRFYYRMLQMCSRYPDILWEQWFVSHEACLPHCVLDYHCELYYCCGGEWRRFAGEVVDGLFRNKRTGSYPYILHAPMPRRSLPIRERIAKELGII